VGAAEGAADGEVDGAVDGDGLTAVVGAAVDVDVAVGVSVGVAVGIAVTGCAVFVEVPDPGPVTLAASDWELHPANEPTTTRPDSAAKERAATVERECIGSP
jgi:hypothetical protein